MWVVNSERTIDDEFLSVWKTLLNTIIANVDLIVFAHTPLWWVGIDYGITPHGWVETDYSPMSGWDGFVDYSPRRVETDVYYPQCWVETDEYMNWYGLN